MDGRKLANNAGRTLQGGLYTRKGISRPQILSRADNVYIRALTAEDRMQDAFRAEVRGSHHRQDSFAWTSPKKVRNKTEILTANTRGCCLCKWLGMQRGCLLYALDKSSINTRLFMLLKHCKAQDDPGGLMSQ